MVKVVVYTVSDCEECELTLNILSNLDREYEEVKLDRIRDIDMINAFLVKGFGKFPVVSIDDWKYSWCGHKRYFIIEYTKSSEYYFEDIKENVKHLEGLGYTLDDVINYLSKGACWKPSPDYIEFVMGER